MATQRATGWAGRIMQTIPLSLRCIGCFLINDREMDVANRSEPSHDDRFSESRLT